MKSGFEEEFYELGINLERQAGHTRETLIAGVESTEADLR
jgi:hypothetical protein